MPQPLSPSAQKVQTALTQRGFSNQVIELPDSARTAAEAAQAIGCTVAQIAKSLIFTNKATSEPVLIIASGINRVNEKAMRQHIGGKLGKANADFVREQTGFVIGGVPPLGHTNNLNTFIDEDLLQYNEIWAAAGNPFAVFKLTPAQLVELTNGLVVSLK